MFGENYITNFAHNIWVINFYTTPLKFHIAYGVQLHVLDYLLKTHF